MLAHTVIRPGPRALSLSEVWAFRELLYFLVWRDLMIRYKQTWLGVLWALFQPTSGAIIFALVFARGVGPVGVPYPLFLYTGLLLWTLFARAVGDGAQSLSNASHIIVKVYFPRIYLPLASLATALVDFCVGAVFLVAAMLFFRVTPSLAIVLVIPALALTLMAALALELWLSALGVRYRDVRYVLPFFLQASMFLTPVLYPSRVQLGWLGSLDLPGWLLGLNPMVGALELFRSALLPGFAVSPSVVAASVGMTALLFVTGGWYFQRVESTMADVL